MKTLLNKLLKTRRRPRRHPPKPTAGYTMVELVVGMVVAALIITPLLTFVVNVLDSDVKEQAKTNSQQELQAAIDYIAQDMSQAIHVYDPTEVDTIEALADDVRPIRKPTGAETVLVFWKRKALKDALVLDPDICTVTTRNDCKDDTFVYSLVAYYLVSDTNSTWCQPSGGTCPSRITRLEVSDAAKNLQDDSYVDTDGDGTPDPPNNGYNPDNISNYETPLELAKGPGTLPNTEVLVNYVEDFKLDGVTNNKLAKITIVGSAKSRIPGQFSQKSCDPDDVVDASEKEEIKKSPYCPKATAQVGARSGFGE